MRVLGIDYGDKKIGLAFGESATALAFPLEVISNEQAHTITELAARVSDEGYDQIVVGVPLPTGAHHTSEQLEKTRMFIRALREIVDVPVIEEDESYTTADSIRLQKEGAHAEEDALAAMLIVESYLSRNING